MSRKLDAKIAEGLGYEVSYAKTHKNGELVNVFTMPNIEKGEYRSGCPLYSSDGNAMLELIGEMVKRDWSIDVMHLPCDNAYEVSFHTKDEWGNYSVMEEAVALTLPLAVALAAYKALTGKEWSGE